MCCCVICTDNAAGFPVADQLWCDDHHLCHGRRENNQCARYDVQRFDVVLEQEVQSNADAAEHENIVDAYPDCLRIVQFFYFDLKKKKSLFLHMNE